MENSYRFPIKDVGYPNNKLDNQTLSGSFSIISNSSVFTDIRNEFSYASRFRNDMRALFIELHVLHRSYKSQEKLRVKEQKIKEAASSTNIEDTINDNRNNEISTVANTDERKRKSADNTNNEDHNNDNKNNQISTKVVANADAVAGTNTDDNGNPDLKGEDVTIDTAILENNRTKIIQTAYSIANNGAGADVGERIKYVKNLFNEEEIEQKDTITNNINNNNAEPDDDNLKIPYQINSTSPSKKEPNSSINDSDTESSSTVSKLTCSIVLKKCGRIKKKNRKVCGLNAFHDNKKNKKIESRVTDLDAYRAAQASIKYATREEIYVGNRIKTITNIKKFGDGDHLRLTGATEKFEIEGILGNIQRYNISPSEDLDIPDILQFLVNRLSPTGGTTKMPVEDLKILIDSYGIPRVPEDGTERVSSSPVSSPVRVSPRRKANQPERFRHPS